MSETAMDPAQVLEGQEKARHSIINETIARGDSPVQRFYAGAVVFISGGSGFLGKQLIEKLLRSCNINKIFILLRAKKQQKPEERLKKLLDDAVYEDLHKLQPGFSKKLVPISGNTAEDRLGISAEDWGRITEEVDFIFHGAATINFTDPLKKATLTNVRGTQEVLSLAKACKKLRSIVHISTAYTHATPERFRKPVLEQFYQSPISPDALLNIVSEIDESTLDRVTPEIIKPWPNTYAFTKAVAEELVRNEAADLPICIVRPAIVISAFREPSPGWIDRMCILGPSGFIVGSGLGILHVIYGDYDCALDFVPVDLVNNAVIAAARETVLRRGRGETDATIYTITGARNPMTLRTLIDFMVESRSRYACPLAVWYGAAWAVKNKFLFTFLSWLIHFIPGYIVDSLLFVLGKKRILTKVYDKVYTLNSVLGYFMKREWKFGDSNLSQMYWNLSPNDRIIFNMDMETIDWRSYVFLWVIGCRKYIVKDGLQGTKKAIKMQYCFRIVNYVAVILYAYVLYRIASLIFGSLFYVCCTVFGSMCLSN